MLLVVLLIAAVKQKLLSERRVQSGRGGQYTYCLACSADIRTERLDKQENTVVYDLEDSVSQSVIRLARRAFSVRSLSLSL